MILKSRRTFLATAAAGTALLAMPNIVRASNGGRSVSFHNLHTEERLSATYWRNGRYDNGALREIDTVLRDFRTGDVHDMDPKLMDLLHNLQQSLRIDEPFGVISGYRSPKTNALLRKASTGVAKKSFHMKGQAIDIRLAGVELQDLHRAAVNLKAGGVGMYVKSDFVHVDTGPVRYW
ncbi:Uncharacterized conserved protein YcbK, DUF882 family [Tistlia consotensis]|uniref:Murein endopeptidase K n=1 Tax=Tistlia consotensis USBA 355 TaxID=560819 RepID=A0A1Y6CL72_9PROT|nr:DUF882 domain-containing protein [Tistlia consotensis]SMF74909.1 Uncharacterized conserved protein YcbK, DUF882 family [Tistlia consotensis USBA 355]SNS11381.1 Uncharacterized conserved protein YcbK, DUF882 family [Tistlia consotensis]